MDFHEYANIYPMMSADEFSELAADIKANGFNGEDFPIKLFNGQILDGRNRWKACDELGITPVYSEFEGSKEDALVFVQQSNKRRNLTKAQLTACAVEAEPIYSALAKERMERGRPKEGTQKIAEDNKGEAREKAAQDFGINRQYVSDGKKIKNDAPDVFEAMKQGAVSVPEAKKIAKLDKETQQDVVTKINSGAKAKDAIKEVVVEKNKKEYLDAQSSGINEENAPTIYIENCLEHEPPDIDLLITDPPYSTDVENIEEFANEWLSHIIPRIKKTGRGYICIGAYPDELVAYISKLKEFNGLILDNPIIWTYRNTLGVTPKNRYNLNYQVILHVYYETSHELDSSISKEMFSVQDINAPDGRMGNRVHAWQKPDELAMRLVRHGSKKGDVIYDPFACTGAFLIAAAKMGRIASGCEINEEHAEIALNRGCVTGGKNG